MAAIDKIYITGWNNYCIFYDWVCNLNHELTDKYGKKVQLSNYLWKFKNAEEWAGEDNPEEVCHPVMNNPYFVDAYIIRNCPFDFIQKELMINYGYWSQERIQNFYNSIKNWNVNEDGPCPYWAKLEDFTFNEDGTITLNGLEKSDYEMILDNELYTKPYREDVEHGKHFRMTKSPNDYGYPNFNRPLKGTWFVDIVLPAASSCDFMWHHQGKTFFSAGTWDFCDEFVECDRSSSCAHARTITALKRYIRKWKLPIGAKVVATGRYDDERYEFIVTR